MVLRDLQLLIDWVHLRLVIVIAAITLPGLVVARQILLLKIVLLLLAVWALQIRHPTITSLLLAFVATGSAAEVLVAIYENIFHLYCLPVGVWDRNDVRGEVDWIIHPIRIIG